MATNTEYRNFHRESLVTDSYDAAVMVSPMAMVQLLRGRNKADGMMVAKQG